MRVTAIVAQQRDERRVNIFIDDVYRCSLDVAQVVELGIKVGNEYTEAQLADIENESVFGKLYARALEYCLMRPHSSREVRDYLYKKCRSSSYWMQEGGLSKRSVVSRLIAERVFNRLVARGYIDDSAFAKYWVENRHLTKGVSRRKLVAELRAKGVDDMIIQEQLSQVERHDEDEIKKVIAKKRRRYPDCRKLTQYLARQGFAYDDINRALSDE